jgi:hypothetical protein
LPPTLPETFTKNAAAPAVPHGRGNRDSFLPDSASRLEGLGGTTMLFLLTLLVLLLSLLLLVLKGPKPPYTPW